MWYFLLVLAIFLSGCSLSPGMAAIRPSSTPSLEPLPTATSTPVPTPTPVLAPPKAFYRSGQTFLIWPEATWLSGETYRIYRSVSPITAERLSTLKPIAEVGKNSAVFYSNRYHEPGSSAWKPRYLDRLAVQDGGAEIPAGWGLLVWTLSPQDFGGAAEGEGYYAITLQPKDGPEQFNPRSVVGPIKEAVAEPSPVDITASSGVKIGAGGHVFIQFMDLRNWNPTFHAPNPTNEYYGLESSDPGLRADLQYAY
ncbi:MAG TPA: hypothetical protein VF813_03175, partial [Anaerolineaceae bacterium]